MENKITCAIVKDLLPNYVEKLTSEETNSIMERHFDECKECTKVRDEMIEAIKVDTVPEIKEWKRYMNRTKSMYLLKGIVFSMGIIAVLVCFIVDVGINRRLTWSLIVDMGILYAAVCAVVAAAVKKHKIVSTLAAATVFILPMLWGFEYVINANYLNPPVYWFMEYALPITLIWLAVIWISVFFRCVVKINIWNTIGVLLLLVTAGSVLTELLTEKELFLEAYFYKLQWIESAAYLACAALFFVIGFMKRSRKIKETGQ